MESGFMQDLMVRYSGVQKEEERLSKKKTFLCSAGKPGPFRPMECNIQFLQPELRNTKFLKE